MKLLSIALVLVAAFVSYACAEASASARSSSSSSDVSTSSLPPGTKIVESSNPPYVASVAKGEIVSIALRAQLLKRDMNARNSIRSETGSFKPARYSFPDAHVPESALKHLTDIYKYDRRRDVPLVSSGGNWVLAEYFKAGSNTPVARFQMLGKHVQRQEQLDNGRVVQSIVVGWSPNTSTAENEPSPRADLGEHPAWIRVINVAPTGKRTLVALAWRKSATPHATTSMEAPKDSELLYGVPNGVVKWQTKAEFVKANGIDLEAKGLSGLQTVAVARLPAVTPAKSQAVAVDKPQTAAAAKTQTTAATKSPTTPTAKSQTVAVR
jgi:hypothetical protein